MKQDIIILFDLDGTLIDSTDAILESFYHSFKELKFDFTGEDEDIKNLIGYPLDEMYKGLGVSDELKWDFVASYKEHYRKISKQKTILLNNALQAVRLASSFARLSVVTTKTRKYTIPLLQNLEILEDFEIVTGRENVQNPKPNPEPILTTLKQMNYDEKVNKVYMIGDTILDLIAAQKAGINSVGVLCGYGKKDDLEKYTSNICETALEAVEFIKKQNR